MPRARPKRSTALNMTPVAGIHPTVTALYAQCVRAGLSMRQLCAMAEPPIHHDVPARWRRGVNQPTVRVLQHLLDTLARYQQEERETQ